MTQKQISYFEKAYETRNIAAAADQMFVSRSVISRSIQELEEEFGVTFFERSKSGITPQKPAICCTALCFRWQAAIVP